MCRRRPTSWDQWVRPLARHLVEGGVAVSSVTTSVMRSRRSPTVPVYEVRVDTSNAFSGWTLSFVWKHEGVPSVQPDAGNPASGWVSSHEEVRSYGFGFHRHILGFHGRTVRQVPQERAPTKDVSAAWSMTETVAVPDLSISVW